MIVAYPSLCARADHRAEVKTDPRSDVIISGKPNLEIQELIRAETHESVFASVKGTASGHLVDRSIIVNKYRFPSDCGRGPTKST